ncbi:flavoprotein, partial [Streptomyces sp. ATMOS53]
GSDLVSRAADVILKERRPLVLGVRETPLSTIHLENMPAVSQMGVTILPPMPARYTKPASVDDIVDHLVARVMDQLGLDSERAVRRQRPATARRSDRRTPPGLRRADSGSTVPALTPRQVGLVPGVGVV